MALSDEQIRLILNLGDSKKNVDEVKAALDAMGDAAEDAARAGGKVEEGTKKAAAGTRDFGRATLETGRVVQDFAQGGIGGILNNVEGLVSALGGGSGLAGLITGVGVAAYLAYPPLRDFVKGVVEGKNDIPKAAESLGTLAEELKTVGERLKDIKEKGFLTDAELAEHNALLEKQAGIEKRIADEKERQSVFDKAKKEAAQAGASPDSAAVAETIINDMMGGVDAARGEVGRSLVAESQRGGRLRELNDAQSDTERRRRRARDAGQDVIQVDGPGGQKYAVDRDEYFDAVQRKAWAEYQAEVKRLGTEADKAVEGALKGDSDAARRMAFAVPSLGPEWLQATRGGQAASDRFESDMMGSTARTPEQKAAIQARRDRQKKDAADRKLFEAGALKHVEDQRRIDQQRADAETRAEFETFNQGREANLDRAAGVREQQQNMTEAQKAVQLQRDAQDKQALQGVAANRFGFDLSDDQAADALKEARDLMGKKVPQVEAGRSAIAGIVQEVLQTAQQMSGGQMMQEAEIQSLRMQLQALQQNQRFTRTRMNHTR